MAITFQSATAKNQASVGSGSYSFSHNVGSGNNRYLFVQTQGDDTLGTDITNVGYGSSNMNLLLSYRPTSGAFGTSCPFVKIWGLANPDAGNNTISVDYTGRASSAIASSYNGCSPIQGTINYYTATDAARASALSGTLSGYTGGDNWLLGFASINGSVGITPAASTDTTDRAHATDVGQFGYINSDNNGVSSVNTLNWTSTSGVFWTIVLMQLEVYVPTVQQMLII